MQRLEIIPSLPDRPRDGHKGTFGRVLVVGGDEQMLGAPVLAGTAALRAGSGLVQIAVPKSMLPAALSITPELIGLGLPRLGVPRSLLNAASAADVLVIGPGLGQSRESAARVLKLISLDQPKVIDADALNILSTRRNWPMARASAVLTPHPGEMRRLARLFGADETPDDDSGRLVLATAAAKAFSQVVLLKGARSVVTDGRRVYVNRSGDDSLAKAGSGDVLSGIIGSLIGQGLSLFDSACLGAYLHGKAGEAAGRQLGTRSVLARDVIAALPAAIRSV